MKTLLAVVGAITVGVIVLATFFFVRMAIEAGPYVAEATTYVDEAVPAITAKWDPNEITRRASPELKAQITREAFAPMVALMAPLGAMTKYQGATCSVSIRPNAQFGAVTANCTANALYEKGTAIFYVNLVRQDKDWSLLAFIVRPTFSGVAPAAVSFGLGSIGQPAGVTMQLHMPQSLPFFGDLTKHKQRN